MPHGNLSGHAVAMAARRRDPEASDTSAESAAGPAPAEDHSWLDDDPRDRAVPRGVKVGKVRHAKAGRVRGANPDRS